MVLSYICIFLSFICTISFHIGHCVYMHLFLDIGTSCWVDYFWIAYCAHGDLVRDEYSMFREKDLIATVAGVSRTTFDTTVKSPFGVAMIPSLEILKKLQSDYWMHHRSVYETITQLQQVLAHALSRKGSASSWWWWSLITKSPRSQLGNPSSVPMTTTTTDATSFHDRGNKASSSFWQPGLLAWFTTYVSAKRWLLVDGSDEEEDGASRFKRQRGVTTGCEMYEYYDSRKQSVGGQYNILLSILTSLRMGPNEQQSSTWCPLRPNHTRLELTPQCTSGRHEPVPLYRLLQTLDHVRRLLVSSTSFNDQFYEDDALFLRTYLNRKCNGVNDLEKAHVVPSPKSDIMDPWTRNALTRVNELIVLVGEQLGKQEKELSDPENTTKSDESTLPALHKLWQELLEKIENRLDSLGSIMRRRAVKGIGTANINEGMQENGSDPTSDHAVDEEWDSCSDAVWDVAHQSLSAHLRREIVDAALVMASSGVDQSMPSKSAVARKRGTETSVRTILPISHLPGLLLDELLLRDRILVTRDEWFELFFTTARHTQEYQHRTATHDSKQDYANLFVLGVWYLVQCGLVQEKLQHVSSSAASGLKRSTVVVYEKTSLVWCSGDG
jgi:hypothetical protein